MRFYTKFFILIFLIFIQLITQSECRKFNRHFLRKQKFSVNGSSKFIDNCKKFSFISQNVDHFNFNPNNNLKYQQRYILFDDYVSEYRSDNPIFFYTGNEGDIQWFCENTGFVWEIASKFGALVVFAEHRYYGQSLPFGNKSFENPQISYLTSEQALADYAYLIRYIKSNRTEFEHSPVIAFGGSYGGMLSAWFRMKYPNLVTGAIAASAPIWQFVSDCDSFLSVVTNAFHKADSNCPNAILNSWDLINQLSTSTQGLNSLTKIFRLCEPLKKGDDLKEWLNDIYGNIAMANYPYATNFLSPLPAWPVKVMCNNITKTLDENKINKDPMMLLEAIYKGVNVYQNYTGQATCFDLGSSTPFDINMISWTYQTCTEFVFPFCSNGVNDMFEKQDWDYAAYSKDCYSQFKTLPRDEWPVVNYGGSAKDIMSHSNIVFSNGDLDPWSSGGVLSDVNERMPAILIENGAHHLDLRESNPNDPDSVVLARFREIEEISKWIKEYNLKKN